MSHSSKEPRSWEEPDELDRMVHELREQIEGLKAQVRVYRSVVHGEGREESEEPARER